MDIQCLSVDELKRIFKGRAPRHNIADHEKNADDVNVLWSAPIAMFIDKVEKRGISGLVLHPPRFYLARYDVENNAVEMVPAHYRVLEHFAPDAMNSMWERAAAIRVFA